MRYEDFDRDRTRGFLHQLPPQHVADEYDAKVLRRQVLAQAGDDVQAGRAARAKILRLIEDDIERGIDCTSGTRGREIDRRRRCRYARGEERYTCLCRTWRRFKIEPVYHGNGSAHEVIQRL